MRKFKWPLISAFFLGQIALAAENKLPTQEESQESDSSVLQEEAQIEIGSNQEVDGNSGLVAAEKAEDDKDEPADRFIPTEEISQDLGVSFPVDI
jgi:hypothetical protein